MQTPGIILTNQAINRATEIATKTATNTATNQTTNATTPENIPISEEIKFTFSTNMNQPDFSNNFKFSPSPFFSSNEFVPSCRAVIGPNKICYSKCERRFGEWSDFCSAHQSSESIRTTIFYNGLNKNELANDADAKYRLASTSTQLDSLKKI